MKRSLIFHVAIVFMVLSMFISTSSCKKSKVEARTYGWFDFVIPDSDTSQNAVDMSFLNEKIAGGSGFIRVQDGHFVKGDGERIRFFGTNLTFSSCFPDKETAKNIAGRLRKLGMNVVRFHHMDNQPTPGGIWDKNMKDLDADQLDKLDWLIYQLKIHGIYSNLNTHVSRDYPEFEYEEIGDFNYGKGIDQFYRPYIEMQKDYARKLLTHKNPYTGNIYTEEPAVAFFEVNNENSLLSNWALLPQLKRQHKASISSLWKTWLASEEKYKNSTADLMGIISNYSKASDQQKEMMWMFLTETEMAYAKEMIEFFKNDLKIKAPISETQAYYSGITGVHREAQYSDFIDMHAYWQHPNFPGKSWSSTNWTIPNSSMVSDKKGGTLRSFAQHRVQGMPLTISEYDHPAPSFFCAEMFPMLNSFSAYQDFDGIYHFTFDHPYDKGRIDNFFASSGHPLKQVFVPVGAALFRMSAIKPGQNPVTLDLPLESIADNLVKFGDKLRLHVSNMNFIWEEAGATDALPILHPMNINVKAKELKLSSQPVKPAGPWESETGEIIWDNADSAKAVYKINAPSAKAAVGYIGGQSIDLGNVTIAMDATPYNWSAITFTALDGKPVEESSKILLVAAGRVENKDMKWDEKKTTVGGEWGNAPTTAEGIPALLTFRNMKEFRVHSLDPSGNTVKEITVNRKKNELFFGIGAQYETLWYIITRD